MRRRVGSLLVAAGLALVLAALGLAAYNLHDSNRAQAASSQVAEQLASAIGQASDAAASASTAASPTADGMPTVTIDGREYVGLVRIPSLGLELPVLAEWSYEGLEVAPCRYSGSAYAGDLVLAGHNYVSHFGRLASLSYGAEVSFVDVRGNVFVYQVASIEELDATSVEDMTESEWPLTLFTCNFSGAARTTVRCEEA